MLVLQHLKGGLRNRQSRKGPLNGPTLLDQNGFSLFDYVEKSIRQSLRRDSESIAENGRSILIRPRSDDAESYLSAVSDFVEGESRHNVLQ